MRKVFAFMRAPSSRCSAIFGSPDFVVLVAFLPKTTWFFVLTRDVPVEADFHTMDPDAKTKTICFLAKSRGFRFAHSAHDTPRDGPVILTPRCLA
jgi:hypothetical protein